MTDNTPTVEPQDQAAAETPPSDQVRALDRLIGRWTITGGSRGTVTYEWMEGGYFLLQRVELEYDGQRASGLEVIGNLRPYGQAPSAEVHSRFYDSGGNTFDYVYELADDTLRIWAGERGSPAYFSAPFPQGATEVTGEWVFPGGGGYTSTMTRSDP
ncbi:MAG: hypothetical protein M3235_03450 [Actinomycetota bacterium]|nr:hypothetical protein [Actinomycetota bacterium]